MINTSQQSTHESNVVLTNENNNNDSLQTTSDIILNQRTLLKQQYLDHLNNIELNDKDNTNKPTDSDDGTDGNDGNSNNETPNDSDDKDQEDDSTEKEDDFLDAYNMTPKQIMNELDKYVIGQNDAKKAVAVSWRARWRRRQLSDDFRREVTPKNILMMGPTGCGKTEVARRLARLSYSPFVKVEATKFTEVGYVGKDVNTIIEDLVSHAATLVKKRKKLELKSQLKDSVNEILLNSLMGKISNDQELKYWKKKLQDGSLDDMNVEIDVMKEHDLSSFLRGGLRTSNPYLVFAGSGDSAPKTEKKQYPIKRAKEILIEQELKTHLSDSDLANQSLELAENDGIVFIDEIDKICGTSKRDGGGERRVSQEGVQRDLLPLIEGTSVSVQNYGKLNTDHILFICAGAFHDSKPKDLMPEFQGRLPVRVNLKALTKDDMIKILSCTEYNLVQQQIEMLKTENCKLIFKDDAIEEIANTAVLCNDNVENIGARRLVTVIEKIMADINVEAAEYADKKDENKEYVIDSNFVKEHIDDIIQGEDLERFIL